MEKALVLDPSQEAVRGAFADVLSERAGLAERTWRPGERDELLQRLRLYDTTGERLARFEAPLRVNVRTRPAGATVSLARYEPASDGRRVLTAARHAGSTPLEGLSLERGTWVLELSAPGHAPVRHVLRAEPGPERTLDVALPEAARVPEGFVYVPRGTFLFGTAADENIRQFFDTTPLHEVETGPYLISRTEVTYGEYLRWLETLTPEERARRTPHGAKVASLNAEVELKRLADGRWHLSIHPNGVTYAAPEGEPLRYTTRPRLVEHDWRRLPVGAIDYADARAYAAWLAQHRPRPRRPAVQRAGVGASRPGRGRARVPPRRRAAAPPGQLRRDVRQGGRQLRPGRGGQPPRLAQPLRPGRHGGQRLRVGRLHPPARPLGGPRRQLLLRRQHRALPQPRDARAELPRSQRRPAAVRGCALRALRRVPVSGHRQRPALNI